MAKIQEQGRKREMAVLRFELVREKQRASGGGDFNPYKMELGNLLKSPQGFKQKRTG